MPSRSPCELISRSDTLPSLITPLPLTTRTSTSQVGPSVSRLVRPASSTSVSKIVPNSKAVSSRPVWAPGAALNAGAAGAAGALAGACACGCASGCASGCDSGCDSAGASLAASPASKESSAAGSSTVGALSASAGSASGASGSDMTGSAASSCDCSFAACVELAFIASIAAITASSWAGGTSASRSLRVSPPVRPSAGKTCSDGCAASPCASAGCVPSAGSTSATPSNNIRGSSANRRRRR